MTAPRIAEYAALAELALATGFFTIPRPPRPLSHDAIATSTASCSSTRPPNRPRAASSRPPPQNGVVLEVNGGGPRRGRYPTQDGMDWLYPRTAFWRIVESVPAVKVAIGCDTHNPPDLCDRVIDETIAFAQRFKLNLLPRIDLNAERKRRP
ncbi:MAG: hypothetical protein MZU95_08295 [Desulfomicrobium escambiense]|nr:hypothetical protein [Desulfomicrobium escambiense]